jgi:hypothetical protein
MITMMGFAHYYQFSCGILKMVGTKKQDFWPKINILKGNHCILAQSLEENKQKDSKYYSSYCSKVILTKQKSR